MKIRVTFILLSCLTASSLWCLAEESVQRVSISPLEVSMVVTAGLVATNSPNQSVIIPDFEPFWYSPDDLDEVSSQEFGLSTDEAILYFSKYAPVTCYFDDSPTKIHRIYFTGGVG
jgi:hypothetical protein